MKYITTPIYYVNDNPHVGHAVTTLAADVWVRFQRLKAEEVFFLTGTDEHGAKIAEAATKNSLPPQEFVDKVAQQFKKAWQDLYIQPDGFIRTTNPAHEAYVKEFLQDLYDKGHIYKGEYKGWYCVGCEEFKTETQIGPNNTCLIHLRPLVEIAEKSYLFKLSSYSEQLTKIIESDELKIRPESRKNEVLSFIHEGLRDVAISRKNVEWGITLPWDSEHTVYVWIDALLNYLSAAEAYELTFDSGKKPQFPPTLQLIAKDILRFHAVIWPALLLAAGKPLPEELFVHGYFTVDGQKMSKSLGNVITPQQLIDRYGIDGARYLLLAAVPFGQDGDLSFERLDAIYTSDLANGLGNLVNRVQAMLTKYCDGVVPQLEFSESEDLNNRINKYETLSNSTDFSGVIAHLQDAVGRLNSFIEEIKPWVLVKEEKEAELNHGLAVLSEGLYILAVLFNPFIPHSSEKILALFGTSIDSINYATLGKDNHTAGKTITPIDPLFPRLEQ